MREQAEGKRPFSLWRDSVPPEGLSEKQLDVRQWLQPLGCRDLVTPAEQHQRQRSGAAEPLSRELSQGLCVEGPQEAERA